MSKPILRIVPTMQSLALASRAYKDVKKAEKGKFKPVRSAVRNIVGVNLTRVTANQVEAYPD